MRPVPQLPLKREPLLWARPSLRPIYPHKVSPLLGTPTGSSFDEPAGCSVQITLPTPCPAIEGIENRVFQSSSDKSI